MARRFTAYTLLAIVTVFTAGCRPSVEAAPATLPTVEHAAPETDSTVPEGARSDDDLAAPGTPLGLMLTWQRDPTTTMTIDWHTVPGEGAPALHVRRAGESDWHVFEPLTFPFPHSHRLVHRVELVDLASDEVYEFRLDEDTTRFLFRTMPADPSRPIRFIAGGDVRHSQEWMEQTSRHATSYDPDFVVWGGDLAYANGKPELTERWYEFFEAMRNALVTPEGRVIPVLTAIGNHEVDGSYHHNIADYRQDDHSRARMATAWYDLFAMPGQPGYGVLDFGNYMSLLLLDTDHTNPIDGEQTRWLADALARRVQVPHVFPVYHVPAYPSVRRFDGRTSERVRRHWLPLFERYGVKVAFENHDHAYKRTLPLRAGRRHDDGIVYLGDGAWGTETRAIRRNRLGAHAWYLERAESVRHFILGEVHGSQRRFIMVDEYGRVFDEMPAGAAVLVGNPRFPTASSFAFR